MSAWVLPGTRRLRRSWRHVVQTWLERRVPPEARRITLHRRRIYILPTGLGYTFAVTVVALLLGSMNYNTSIGFAITFLLAGIGMLAMLHTHANLRGLRLHFFPAKAVFAGESAAFPLHLDGCGRSRWQIQLQADEPVTTVMQVHADKTVTAVVYLPARQRGRERLPRVVIETDWPLGLFRVWSWVYPRMDVLVYPQPRDHGQPLPWGDTPEAAEKRRHQQEDDSPSGLRNYQEGDSPRRIAWKVYARTDKVYSREFDQRSDAVVWLDYDALSSLPPEARLEQLCHWVLAVERRRLRYGLHLPNRQIEPGSGPTHQQRCLEALALAPGAD